MAQGNAQGNYGRYDLSQKAVQGSTGNLVSNPLTTASPPSSEAKSNMLQHTVYTALGQMRNRTRG
jgi:hypothetical protein